MEDRSRATEYARIEALKGAQVFFENKTWVVWKVDLERNNVELRRWSEEENKKEEIINVYLPTFIAVVDRK